MKVKVFTGRWVTDKGIMDAIVSETHALHDMGWKYVGLIGDYHPSEVVEVVDKGIADNAHSDGVYFMSNDDHTFNRLRVLRHKKVVDEVEFVYFHRDANTNALVRDVIVVNDDGECSSYPLGFIVSCFSYCLKMVNNLQIGRLRNMFEVRVMSANGKEFSSKVFDDLDMAVAFFKGKVEQGSMCLLFNQLE